MAISFKSLGATPAKIQKTTVITSTQSWTVPADVSQIEILLCGGGGGGAGPSWADNTGYTTRAIFHGGAGSAQLDILNVTPGSSHTVTIGAGGSAVTSNTAGQVQSYPVKGGDSSFGSLLTVSGAYSPGPFNNTYGNNTGDNSKSIRPGGRSGGYPVVTFAESPGNNSSPASQRGLMGYGGAGGNGFMNAPFVRDQFSGQGFDGGGAAAACTYVSNVGLSGKVAAIAGVANTGGGGGGGAYFNVDNGPSIPAANGGSGVAIIKYWSAL